MWSSKAAIGRSGRQGRDSGLAARVPSRLSSSPPWRITAVRGRRPSLRLRSGWVFRPCRRREFLDDREGSAARSAAVLSLDDAPDLRVRGRASFQTVRRSFGHDDAEWLGAHTAGRAARSRQRSVGHILCSTGPWTESRKLYADIGRESAVSPRQAAPGRSGHGTGARRNPCPWIPDQPGLLAPTLRRRHPQPASRSNCCHMAAADEGRRVPASISREASSGVRVRDRGRWEAIQASRRAAAEGLCPDVLPVRWGCPAARPPATSRTASGTPPSGTSAGCRPDTATTRRPGPGDSAAARRGSWRRSGWRTA
jgi:hypothetical protein